ncbi:MAG: CinA family nicotinamide mononucleotide deamidase-related protein, partial [Syntrophaceae bacterium]|nr:CinA family nicotinamide mononucleotide deamidase-related protein [Syntrophaceae bacterium]
MNIGILAIGDELTSGRIQNTNAAWIADRINRQGWHVCAMLAVGDEENAIEQAVAYFPGRCDAVVVTGGLGPTPDDITAEALSKACGLILVRNDQVLTAMQNRFATHSIRWRESHARMALFPEGAEVIPNPVGSAWGFSLMHRGCLFIVLPGVPGEATCMVTDSVIPLLKSHDPTPPAAMVSRTLKCCGITESDLEEKIRSLIPEERGVRIGFYPMFPEVHLVLTARHSSGKIAEEVLDQAEAAIAAPLAPYLFGRNDETLEGVVGTLLTAKGLTLSVAESCTGGLIADRLTDVSGSSLYVERGVVTYSNTAKVDLLQVPEA